MKIKEGFVVREIAGQSFIVALGNASKTLNGMIKLNETARFIWDMLASGAEKDTIIPKMMDEYDVERDQLEADYDRLIATLQEAGIFESE